MYSSALNVDATSVAATVKYKKKKKKTECSPLILCSWKPCVWCIFSRLFPSNHICQLPRPGYHAIDVSKIAMQRGLENEFGVVTGGKHLPGPCDKACFYSLNQKLRPPVAFVFFFMSCKAYYATKKLIGCTCGVGSKMICLEYSVFVLRKFIVLFHLRCLFLFSSLFTLHFFVCHML
jgi:hypothetical protein